MCIIVPAISWSELLFCYRHIVSSFVKNSGGVDYSVIQTGSLLFLKIKKRKDGRWVVLSGSSSKMNLAVNTYASRSINLNLTVCEVQLCHLAMYHISAFFSTT
jgi:hypothetical protein